jgi:hypothetical protein
MRDILKILIKIIHTFVVIFMYFGFLLPKKYLLYFIFTWPIVFLHWQLNDGICCLTQFEYWLHKKQNPPLVHHDFILFKNLFNIKISDATLFNLGCFLSTFSWSIGVYRYYK